MPRVLVADDDEIVRSLFSRWFKSHGYEVVTVGTSEDAIAQFREAPFDLVITDIFMPEEGGLEVIRKLAKEDPRPGIIAVSGFEVSANAMMTPVPAIIAAAIPTAMPNEARILFDGILAF